MCHFCVGFYLQVDTLEKENEMLKLRIRELELLKDRTDVENYRQNHQVGGPRALTVNDIAIRDPAEHL